MTVQLATFTLGEQHYGVPVERVQEVLLSQHCTAVPLAPAAVTGLMNLRGEVVLVLDLRRRLGLPARDNATQPASLVVRIEGESISLLVDHIGDVVAVDADVFEPPPATLGGIRRELIRGVYKLPDHLLMALDVDRTVDVAA